MWISLLERSFHGDGRSERGKMTTSYECVLCDREMRRFTTRGKCSYCGKEEETDYICPNGHYICQDCRVAGAEEIIKKTCRATKERDPVRLAVTLMRHPAVQMHGLEHHYLVACILLAVMRNSPKFSVTDSSFEEAVRRSRRLPLGSCGSMGVCGGAAGAGIALSIATGATFTSDGERALCMTVVSRALDAIARIGGPRCCKASVLATLKVAAGLIGENFKVQIPISNWEGKCEFQKYNEKECLREVCPYFRRTE